MDERTKRRLLLGAAALAVVMLTPRRGRASVPRGGGPFRTSGGSTYACTPVETKRTTMSATEAGRQIAAAWKKKYGERLSDRGVSVLVGMWAHETGRGESMWNYNYGNIRAGTTYDGLCQSMRAHEYDASGRKYWTSAPFRAYNTPELGAHGFVSFLNWTRYKPCRKYVERGDAKAFIRCLKDKGYFTGSASAYADSTASLAESYRRGRLA